MKIRLILTLLCFVVGCQSATSNSDSLGSRGVFTFAGKWHSAKIDTVWRSTKPGDWYVVGDTFTLSSSGGIYAVQTNGHQYTNIQWFSLRGAGDTTVTADTAFGYHATDLGCNYCLDHFIYLCWPDSIRVFGEWNGFSYHNGTGFLYLPN